MCCVPIKVAECAARSAPAPLLHSPVAAKCWLTCRPVHGRPRWLLPCSPAALALRSCSVDAAASSTAALMAHAAAAAGPRPRRGAAQA